MPLPRTPPEKGPPPDREGKRKQQEYRSEVVVSDTDTAEAETETMETADDSEMEVRRPSVAATATLRSPN